MYVEFLTTKKNDILSITASLKFESKNPFARVCDAYNCDWSPLTKLSTKSNFNYLTENRLSRNEIWYAEDNCSYMCHVCAKEY